MKLRSGIILVLLVISVSTTLRSQTALSLSATSSYTVPNSSEFDYIKDISTGLDFSLCWSHEWFARLPYNLGLRATVSSSSDGIAGTQFGLLGFLQEPILLLTPHHHLALDLALGISYYTNPYSRSLDTANLFIGSHLNCLIQAGLVYRFDLNDKSQLLISGKFTHTSNGYLAKPNKGLNYIQLELGYAWLTGTHRDFGSQNAEFEIPDSRFTPFFSFASGLVRPRDSRIDNHLFYAYTARAGLLYDFNPARSVGANLDITYNTTHDELRQIEPVDYKLPFYVGLCGIYEANYDHLTLHLAFGGYLLRSWHQHTPYYERVGLFYNFTPSHPASLRHFVGVSLKSHGAHIDFIEWHYGIKL